MPATMASAWFATSRLPKKSCARYPGRGTASPARRMPHWNWVLTGKRWGRDEAGGAAGIDQPRPAELQTRAALDMRVEHLLDFALADGADALFHHLATLEQQQGGDATDVVAHGGAAVRVHIQLANLHLTGILAGHHIDCGRHLPARPAPLGQKIPKNRNTRAEHVLIERRIEKTQCFFPCHFIS